MKLIRFALLSILFLFAAASFVGLLLPAHVLVSRAVNMNVNRDSVIGYMNDINQWKKWMEGMQEASVTIHSALHADLAGTTVSIIKKNDSSIVSRWTSRNGNIQTSTMQLIGGTTQKITVVQWQFEEHLKWYPWQRLGSMMNDKILGTMMEKNLNNLKSLAEAKRSF